MVDSLIDRRMLYNLFLTVHVPTHNAFCYNSIPEVQSICMKLNLSRGFSESHLRTDCSTHAFVPEIFPLSKHPYHDAAASELTTKRGLQGP
jgi:hypothetical protein